MIPCEGEKVSTGVYGVRRPCQNGAKRSRGPSCPAMQYEYGM